MKKQTTTTAAALALAVMIFVGLNSYAATNVAFLGAGSSAMFNTFALAADNSAQCGTNIWTQKSGASGIDARSSSIPAQTGNIWIVWNTNVTVVCAYLSVDSVVGNELYFATPRATISIPSSEIGTAGANLIPTLTDTTLPQTVYNALNGKAFNAAMTDIRPEDALFAENRALAALNTTNYTGLGYGPGPVGTAIESTFSTKTAVPVAFAIFGNDPITGQKVPSYTTVSVGADPIIVFVNTTNTGSTGDFSNVAAFQNINRFDLTQALNGTYGWTRDISNAVGLAEQPLNIVLREPTSGTYNTMEFDIPRNLEFNSTQELNVNPSATGGNPLNLANIHGGWRKRSIGTGEMVSEVGSSSNGNALGYAFWGTGNFANVTGSTRYLTVDGIDPLFPSYAGGTFPTCVAPCPGIVTFTNVLNGGYPIWSVLRVATAATVPPGVASLVVAAQTQAANTVPDFVPFSQLTVFRSHFTRPGEPSPASNGHIAGKKEAGGDEGGAVITVQADEDNVTDTGKEYLGFHQ